MSDIKIMPAGDSALIVEFDGGISPEVNARVHALHRRISKKKTDGIIEVIPAFRSLLVSYDPLKIKYDKLKKILMKSVPGDEAAAEGQYSVFHIPVCYGGELGEDLRDVAEHTGLTVEEVIALHSKKQYLIYMLGFLPGFPYLGGLDERLFTPRLASPRTVIPAGSVGIGGEQTGIYPLPSPGGWRLIGRTPVKLYDAGRQESVLYRAGDYIKFDPVSYEEYKETQERIDTGDYRYRIEKGLGSEV